MAAWALEGSVVKRRRRQPGTALFVYDRLPAPDRLIVRRDAVARAHPGLRCPIAWESTDCAREDDHPSLVAALHSWWWSPDVPYSGILRTLNGCRNAKAIALAVAFCAECSAPILSGPAAESSSVDWSVVLQIIEYRRSSSADLKDMSRDRPDLGESLESALDGAQFAPESLVRAADAALADSVHRAAGSAAKACSGCVSATGVLRSLKAIAIGLREIYPDPCRIDHEEARRRFGQTLERTRAEACRPELLKS